MYKQRKRYETSTYLMLTALKEDYEEELLLSEQRLNHFVTEGDAETARIEGSMYNVYAEKVKAVNYLLDCERGTTCNKKSSLEILTHPKGHQSLYRESNEIKSLEE